MPEGILMYIVCFVGTFIVLELFFYFVLKTFDLSVLFNFKKIFLAALIRLIIFFFPGLFLVHIWQIHYVVGLFFGVLAWYAVVLLLADKDRRVDELISMLS